MAKDNGRLSILELGNLVLASLVVQTGKFVLGSSNYRGHTGAFSTDKEPVREPSSVQLSWNLVLCCEPAGNLLAFPPH